MSTARSRPPTISDIARAAEVSTATVSYVLSDAPGSRIPESTRERVQAIAQRLGYVPHASAKSLRTGHSDLVLFPLPPTQLGPLASAFLDQLGTGLRKLGYTLVLHGEQNARGIKAAREWAALRPAAVITEAARLTRDSVALLHNAGATVIAMGSAPSRLAPTLIFAHTEMGAIAGRHLVERGCRDITAILPTEPLLSDYGRLRLQALRSVTANHPIQVREVEMTGNPDAAARIAAGWAAGEAPDGVFGYNDEFAGLLLGAAQDHGLRIPDDIALVGADNLHLCDMLRPQLTSVGMAPTMTAPERAAFIANAIQGHLPDGKTVRPWEPTLHVRAT